jgi:hypothetical protein
MSARGRGNGRGTQARQKARTLCRERAEQGVYSLSPPGDDVVSQISNIFFASYHGLSFLPHSLPQMDGHKEKTSVWTPCE